MTPTGAALGDMTPGTIGNLFFGQSPSNSPRMPPPSLVIPTPISPRGTNLLSPSMGLLPSPRWPPITPSIVGGAAGAAPAPAGTNSTTTFPQFNSGYTMPPPYPGANINGSMGSIGSMPSFGTFSSFAPAAAAPMLAPSSATTVLTSAPASLPTVADTAAGLAESFLAPASMSDLATLAAAAPSAPVPVLAPQHTDNTALNMAGGTLSSSVPTTSAAGSPTHPHVLAPGAQAPPPVALPPPSPRGPPAQDPDVPSHKDKKSRVEGDAVNAPA
jgi:hypothetical protein